MTAWPTPQPIETAPRDGTHVLAFDPCLSSWHPVCWLDSDHPDCKGEFHHAWDHQPMEDITHWLPMPPFPGSQS